MKALSVKFIPYQSVIILFSLLVLSCRSSGNKDQQVFQNDSADNKPQHFQVENDDNQDELKIPLEFKKKNLATYTGWLQFITEFSKMNMNNAQQLIQQAEKIIYNERQITQSVGSNHNQQLENSYRNTIYKNQVTFQNFKYIYDIAQEQSKMIQQLNQHQNLLEKQQPFGQATVFNAVLLYMIFGNGYGKSFSQILQPALNWYFSPQSASDIEKGIEYMKAQNKMMASINNINKHETGSSLITNTNQNEKLSDVLLDQKSWIDTETGDVYKLPVEIENPRLNGNEMKAK